MWCPMLMQFKMLFVIAKIDKGKKGFNIRATANYHSLRVLQPVTPPAGNLMSKQRAQLTFDPCMFRRLRETG